MQTAFDMTINTTMGTSTSSPYLGSGSNIIIKTNKTIPDPSDATTKFLSYAFFIRTPSKNVTCELYDASYDVHFNFTNGVQNTFLQNLTYLAPNCFSDANYNLSLPQNKAAQAMMEVMRSILTGYIEGDGTIFRKDTNVLATGLAGCPEFLQSTVFNYPPGFFYGGQVVPSMCRNGSLELAMEDLFSNFTLSLFSSPQLAYVCILSVCFVLLFLTNIK